MDTPDLKDSRSKDDAGGDVARSHGGRRRRSAGRREAATLDLV
jgi:hypothetical protein